MSRLTSRSYLITDRDSIISLSPCPDHLTIEPEIDTSSIGIEQIRDLKTWAQMKPFQTTLKVVLIKKAQNLTAEAQNAMLKLLEEPPRATAIILTVDDSKNLLPTITSRCTQIQLSSFSASQLLSFGLQKDITKSNLLKLSSCQAVLLSGCLADRFAFAEDLASQGRETIVQTLSNWIKNLHSKLHQEENPSQIAQTIKDIEATRRAVLKNANARLAIENLMLEIS